MTKPRRLGTLPKARYLGDVVHIHLLQAEDVNEEKFWYLNSVDAASGFQICWLLDTKGSASVVEGFDTRWRVWAGAPVVLVTDAGGVCLRHLRALLRRDGLPPPADDCS